MTFQRVSKSVFCLSCLHRKAQLGLIPHENLSRFLSFASRRHAVGHLSSTSRLNHSQTSSRETHEGATSSDNAPPSAFGHLLLIIPAAAFFLGTWQVKRRKWKLGLIQDLQARTTAAPIPLNSMERVDLEALEYRRVTIHGEFDHSKELLILPRTLSKPHGRNAGSMMSRGEAGAHVVTPFYSSDLGVSILVNRGFVLQRNSNPATRQQGQVSGEIHLVGLVRKTEKRAPFMPKNDIERGRWYYLDLEEMSKVTGAEPVMIDAVSSCDVPGGPIGGQTKVMLRNEHLQYIITWYSLSFLTGLMWYFGIFKKRRMLNKPAL